MPSRKSKKLEQVRALLAKADSTNYPEEAETFRAKADQLMTAYAIEEWQLSQEEGGGPGASAPESRDVDTSWYWTNSRSRELWQLFHNVSYHCRCKVIYWVGSDTTPLVGLPADLDYFDMLFTSIMLELGKRIEPKAQEGESVEENGYRLRSSGMNWMKTTEALYLAGLLDPPRSVNEEDLVGRHFLNRPMSDMTAPERSDLWAQVAPDERQAMKNRLATKIRNYRRREGLEDYTSVHPSVYQRSYAQGFVAEIASRLRDQRRASGDVKGSGSGSGSGVEIALRDIRAVVDEAAEEMFGERPRARGRSLSQEQATDMRAYGSGARAGREVRISESANSGLGGTRKEINR